MFTRDSAVWWILLIGSLLTFISANFNLLVEAFPGISPTVNSRIQLLSGIIGAIAAYLRMSPLSLSPNSELSGQKADPEKTLSPTGNDPDPEPVSRKRKK